MNRPYRIALVALGSVLLSACGMAGGNPEDFVVETRASPDKVVAALSGVSFGETQMLFGKVPITRERPREGELAWTIQSSDFTDKPGAPGKVALTLEPIDNGQGTRIHVAISVPPVKMLMGKANQVLSEQKVEQEFRKALDQLVGKLNSHSDTQGAATAIGRLLGAVAVAANPKLQARANQLEKDPQALIDMAEADAADRAANRDESVEEEFGRDESRDYRDDRYNADAGDEGSGPQANGADEYAN